MPLISNVWLIISHFQILRVGLTFLSLTNIVSSLAAPNSFLLIPCYPLSLSLSCPLPASFTLTVPGLELFCINVKSISPRVGDFVQRSVEAHHSDFLMHADRMSVCAMPCQTHSCVCSTVYIIFLANEVLTAQALVSFLIETWQDNH